MNGIWQDSSIEPNDTMQVMSGTGVLTEGQLGAFFGQVFNGSYGTADYGTCTTLPPVMTERDYWNAAVEQRKADKRAAKDKA